MKLYHPVRGVCGALRENSYVVYDNNGLEVGQGGLVVRVLKKMLPDRPVDIEMEINAHPVARDQLFGALTARAELLKAEKGDLPARLYTRCAIDDVERHAYFMSMGFDDYDGDELFVLPVAQADGRRKSYCPAGTAMIDVDLSTRIKREEFLSRLKSFGCMEHAREWLEERMKDPFFAAKAVYSGRDYCGELLVYGGENEAVLEMVCVEPKWRGKGVARAMIDEVREMLFNQNIPYLRANSVRRNQNAIRLFQRCGFQWVRTDCYLLGRDL